MKASFIYTLPFANKFSFSSSQPSGVKYRVGNTMTILKLSALHALQCLDCYELCVNPI